MRINGITIHADVRCAMCKRPMRTSEEPKASCIGCKRKVGPHLHADCDHCAPNGPGIYIKFNLPGGEA